MRTAKSLLTVFLIAATAVWAGESVDRTMEARPDVEVEIENIAGSVEVEAWDRNEVRVVAELGDDTEGLQVHAEPDEIRIEVEVPDHSGRWSRRDIDSELKVWVPSGATVSIETVSAGIEVQGVNGGVELESVSGGIEVAGEPPSAEMSTVSGNIRFSGSQTAVEAETVSGSIRLDGVAGRADAATVSGKIEVDAGSVERADFESISGSIEFRGSLASGGRLDASSHSGNVELILPASTAASFEIETFAGDIRSDFGGEARRTSRYAPGRELYHSTGSDARISVETFSGNVYLGKE